MGQLPWTGRDSEYRYISLGNSTVQTKPIARRKPRTRGFGSADPE